MFSFVFYLQRETDSGGMRSVPGSTACIQSRRPFQTEPFFFRYSRKEECIPAQNQIPSYLPLEVERDHTEVSCPNCLGLLGGTQAELTPMGHDWSLDSPTIGLMTVQFFLHCGSVTEPETKHAERVSNIHWPFPHHS